MLFRLFADLGSGGAGCFAAGAFAAGAEGGSDGCSAIFAVLRVFILVHVSNPEYATMEAVMCTYGELTEL